MGDEPPDVGEDGLVEDVIDERPWRARYAGLRHVKGPVDLEVGEKNAEECLKWMNRKVLEHAGFQGAFHTTPLQSHAVRRETELLLSLYAGTSGVALDVISGVASEYLLNVGRTLRFLCDKYAKSMTPEVRLTYSYYCYCWDGNLSAVWHRKSSCIHSSRVGSRKFRISSDISKTTSSGTVLALLTSRRSLLERIAKL